MIRHVIVFNAKAGDDAVREMAAQARRELSAIPGVTDIRFGISVDASARYRYVLDIGFVDEATIARYRTHPIHVRFAAEEFYPLADDRISVDFQLE